MFYRYSLLLFLRDLVHAEEARGRLGGPQGGPQGRIVNGTPVTDPKKFDYIAHAKTCGASLVASNVLLSAAHCGAVEFVTLNKLKFKHAGRQTRETFRVVTELPHPNYMEDGMYVKYDFKLIRINGFSSNNPVELSDGEVAVGEPLTVMGWGLTSDDSEAKFSESLMEAEIDVTDFDTCNAQYSLKLDKDIQFCAGRTVNGVTYDSCNGDSGGPIVRRGAGTDGRDVQVGVVSFGEGCGNKDYPGVYAKVSAVKSWIDGKISEWDCTPQARRRRRLKKPNNNSKKPKATKKPTTKKPKAKKTKTPQGCEWKLVCEGDPTTAPTPAPTPTGEEPEDYCSFVLDNDEILEAVQLYKTSSVEAIEKYGSPEYWSTKEVTKFNQLFSDFHTFNDDISGWDTSGVTDMTMCFKQAKKFNVDIGKWDTSKVTSIDSMFDGAEAFNQDISMWDMSSVTEKANIFMGALTFNKNLCPWVNFPNLMDGISTNVIQNTGCENLKKPNNKRFCQECSSCTDNSDCTRRSCEVGECGQSNVCQYDLTPGNVLRIEVDAGLQPQDLEWDLREVASLATVMHGANLDKNEYTYDVDVCTGQHEICVTDAYKEGGHEIVISYKHTEVEIVTIETAAGVDTVCKTFDVAQM